MKIFDIEKKDGLEQAIASNNSIAFEVEAKPLDKPTKQINLKAVAEANKDQIDLYYLHTVLVSTGWNKNDDVFLPDQTWAARNTPEDKPFNFMHEETDVIGHITGSYVLDSTGSVVADDSVNVPSEFDIVTESVIYKAFSQEANRQRIQRLIAEIDEGKWYVSMECIFPSFNYAVLSPEGKSFLLERSEASAYLTKHLKAYGGKGEYEGYKIGRALSNISFSGKGLVSKPANPRSVILKSKAFALEEKDFTENFLSIGEKKMADGVDKTTIDTLQSQLNEAKAEAKAARTEAEEKTKAQIAQLEKERDEAVATVTEKNKEIETLTSKAEETEKTVAGLEETVKEKDSAIAKSKEEVDKMKKEQMEAKRKAKLTKAGLTENEANEEIVVYASMTEEAFDTVVARMEKVYKEKEEATKKSEANDTKGNKEPKGKAEDEEKKEEEGKAQEAEATDSDFEGTKADATVTDTDASETESAKASVQSWIEENLLDLNKDKK